VSGRPSDVPTASLKPIAKALADWLGRNHAGGVAQPKGEVEKGSQPVEERLIVTVNLHRVPAAFGETV